MNNPLVNHPDATELAIYCAMGIAFLVAIAWRAYQRNRPSNDSSDEHASLIISMIGLNASLSSLKSGTINGYKYNLLISGTRVASSLGGRVILSIDLPFTTPAHIAGFGVQDKNFKTALDNTNIDNSMIKVDLEGDFPDYFRLYCQPGREVELREVLSPTTMQFLVDYCKRMQWEIIDNNLYFAQSDAGGGDEKSDAMFSDAQLFIKQILPTLQKLESEPS